MPLSDKQRAMLEEEAKRRGIDPAKLIAAAERSTQSTTAATKAEVSSDEAPPNLYMYHLPFVTVNEVRERWLKLPPVSGGEQYAAEWAAQRGGTTKPSNEDT